MKKNIKITHDEWIREMFKPPVSRPPNSFTVADVMKVTNLSESSVRREIENKINKGELKAITGKEDGKMCKFYIEVKNVPN